MQVDLKRVVENSVRSYCKWNKVFRVLKHDKSGLWYAGGKRRGYQDYILDKLGMCLDGDEMQRRLDAWAKRCGAVLVIPQGCQRIEQGRLF